MAKIFNFTDFRPGIEKISLEDLVLECQDIIGESWAKHAQNNKLNQHFVESVYCAEAGIDYLSNLSALSALEQKIDLPLILLAPGSTLASQLGWVAGFAFHGKKIETPTMVSEPYARCFNILLYLRLCREQSRANLTTRNS